MKVVMRPIGDVIPYAGNPRRIPQDAIDAVAKSISEFGWRQPIVVDGEGVVIAGHTRLLAAHQLGMDRVPVHVASDLSPSLVRTYRLADNAAAERTEWDFDALKVELTGLRDDGVDLALTALDRARLDELMRAGVEADQHPGDADTKPAGGYQEQYGVIVICDTEAHQQRVYDQLVSSGHKCRVVVT